MHAANLKNNDEAGSTDHVPQAKVALRCASGTAAGETGQSPRQEPESTALRAQLRAAEARIVDLIRANEVLSKQLSRIGGLQPGRIDPSSVVDHVSRAQIAVVTATLASLTADSSLDGFIGPLLKTMVEQLGAQEGALWKCDTASESQRLYLNYEDGKLLRGEETRHPWYSPQKIPRELIDGWKRGDPRPLVIDTGRAPHDPEWTVYYDYYAQRGIKTVLMVPLITGDQLVGNCAARFTAAKAFRPDELQLARVLALQATLALQLAHLGERAQQTAVALAKEKLAREQAAQLAETNQALRESEERFRRLTDLSSDWYWEQDEHLRYTSISSNLFPNTGVPLEDYVGKTRFDMDHEFESEEKRREHAAQLAARQPFRNLVLRQKRPDGAHFYAAISGAPIFDAHGSFKGYRGIGRDITAEVSAKAALEAEVVERRRVEHLVRAHAALLADTLHSITREPTLDAFIGQVLKTIVEQLGGMGGTFSVPGPFPGTARAYLHYQDGRVVPGEASDHPARVPQRVPHPSGAWTAETAEPEILDAHYMDTDPAYAPFREWAQRQGVRTVLQIPLFFGAEGFGVLAVRFPVERQFGPDELELAKALALQGSLAVRLARLSEDARQAAALQEREHAAQQRAGELDRANTALQRTLSKLVGAEDLKPLLEHILREAGELAQAKMAGIFLYDRQVDTHSLTWCVRNGEPVDLANDAQFDIWRAPIPSASLKAWHKITEAGRYSWFSYDEDGDHPRPYALEWHRSMGHHSILAVPLLVGEQALGFMALFFGHDAPPLREHIELARLFGHQAAAAIQLARLGEQARMTAVIREREEAARDNAATLKALNEALRAEIAERRRAEQVARAHAAVISTTLESIRQEASSDAFIAQVLKTMVERLGGTGGSLWMAAAGSDVGRVVLNYHLGTFQRGADIDHPGAERHEIEYEEWQNWNRYNAEPLVLDTQHIETAPTYARFRPWALRLGIKSVLLVPLVFGDESMGTLAVRFDHEHRFSDEEMQLAKALALQATLSLQLAHLGEQGRKSAVLEERNRMARDIHDTLAQGFTGVIIQLEAAADAIARRRSRDASGHLQRAADLARQSLAEARRSVHALKSLALEQADLGAALSSLLTRMTAGTGVRARFSVQGGARPLAPDREEHLLRIGQEALTNAIRHASPSHFEAILAYEPSSVSLTLRDDGRGFDPAAAVRQGIGLIGMHERAAAIGAQLQIRSSIGAGTEIIVALND